MSLEYVAEMFDWIEATPGKNAKIAGLRQLQSAGGQIESYAKELLSIAFDWYRRFGIASLEDCPTSGRIVKLVTLDFFEYCKGLESGELVPRADEVQQVLWAYPAKVYKWLRRCLLKDLRMGVAETTINKVWPGHIKTFECALAGDLLDLDKLRYPVFVEPKIDGVRCLAICPQGGYGKIDFLSRSGHPLYNTKYIESELRERLQSRRIEHGIVYDGELFYQSLKSTMSLVRAAVSTRDDSKISEMRYHIFDAIPHLEWQTQSVRDPLAIRKIAGDIFGRGQYIKFVEHEEARDSKRVDEIYVAALQAGHEGVMVKNPVGLYIFDRTDAWLKYKPDDTDIFQIVGVYPGDEHRSHLLGGLTVQSSDHATTNVGGGFSLLQRMEFLDRQAELIGKIIEVKFKERTSDGKLREPVFIGFVPHG